MKSPARWIAAITLLCSGSAMDASPLLFINYSSAATMFADARAGQLALSHSVLAAFAPSQLAGKSVVVMPGMDSYSSLLADHAVLDEFVNDGGYLWINLSGPACLPNSVPGGAGFAGYLCESPSHDTETIVAPNHEYFTGAYDTSAHVLTASDMNNWNSSDSGHVVGAPSNATILLTNVDGPSLVEYSYGKGWVVVSTLTYAFGGGGARTAALDNMLLYAAGQRRGSASSIPESESGVPETSTAFLFATGGVCFGLAKLLRRR
jgi:hypothetical protein